MGFHLYGKFTDAPYISKTQLPPRCIASPSRLQPLFASRNSERIWLTMLIPIDSDMDFFTSLQKLSRPFAFFRHGEKRPRFLVMFQPSPSHWVINMVGFFAALLSETGWIISAAQLLSWFANFEQTSLAEVAMSHIRVASVPSTSWTGTVTCWPLNLYIRVYIYMMLGTFTSKLAVWNGVIYCYIVLMGFHGITLYIGTV